MAELDNLIECQCIICGKRSEGIRCKDGPVCNQCMPSALYDRAGLCGKHNIEIYKRLNPGWSSVVSSEGRACKVSETYDDRSRAITSADGVILFKELNRSICSSISLDMIVSFIRMSGLNLLIDSLRDMTSKGGKLRIITTAYLGATEYEALQELLALRNTTVRMELDARDSRIHAKSFIFTDSCGKSVAYVGSANISRPALTTGEEWVVKIREDDVPAVISDLRRSFEQAWASPYLKTISVEDRVQIESALDSGGKLT